MTFDKRQQTIQTKRREIEGRIAFFKGEVEAERARLSVLHEACTHPDQYQTSHQGEPCTHCPDCGWEL